MDLSRRRRVALAGVVSLVGALAACASAPGGQAPTGDATISVVEDAESANLVLYVSNQSFEHGVVRIDVEIDGVAVVGQDFDVEDQHNWIEFPIELPPGEHAIAATSSTGVESGDDVTIPDGEQRWLVVDYWYYPDKGDGSDVVDPSFTFNLSDQPVGFG